MSDILVSINCTTFNHEDYIADAIESFLMQKTNFKYEILIHDDASTDRTAEIIKEYEKKYPEIIKPIYQKENQYSKGIKIGDINCSRALGKYIAICEGDDYWTDPYKLQKQVDYMEKYPECSACVHAAIMINAKTNRRIGRVRPSKEDKDFCVEEVILGGGGLFVTNSILYRRKFSKLPQFYYNSPVGDFPLTIHLATCGKVHYMDQYMSIYRVGVHNSWTSRMSRADSEKRRSHFDSIEKMLNEVNEYTGGKYSEVINQKIMHNRFTLLILEKNYQDAKEGILKEYYKSLSLKKKLKIAVKQYFPLLVSVNSFFKGV